MLSPESSNTSRSHHREHSSPKATPAPRISNWHPGNVQPRPVDDARIVVSDWDDESDVAEQESHNVASVSHRQSHAKQGSSGHAPHHRLEVKRPARTVAAAEEKPKPTVAPTVPPKGDTHAAVGVPAHATIGLGQGQDPWPWWLIVVVVLIAVGVFMLLCAISRPFSRAATTVLAFVFLLIRKAVRAVALVLAFLGSLGLRVVGFVGGVLAKGGHALVMTHVFGRAQDKPWDPRSYPRRRAMRMPVATRRWK